MGRIVLTVTLCLLSTISWGANIHDEAGTTGAAFLKIDGGSRPAGMGGAFVGLANDINTIFSNPAGLTVVHAHELTAMQNFEFADISNQSIGYAQREGDLVWGASFLGAFTEIERRIRPSENPDSTVNVGGFAAGLSLAYPISPSISVGTTVKAISQQLDLQNSFGGAIDLGAVWRTLDDRLGFGIAAQNLGVLDEGEALPRNVRGGIAYRIHTPSSQENDTPSKNLFAVVADVDVPMIGAYPTFRIGAENWFHELIAARIGYRVSKGENPKNGVTVGIGIRRKGEDTLKGVQFQFDYALVPDANVGNAHRLAFITRF
ncbi:MAG: PorV/PorQ family protein [Candidatus Poribacteria bacterium]|nr:PorV/PorQ family protein [Candidatus Poribacteria bacterium]MDE0506252.1 PorV/PorQ family protein [Candidatus Poribacteria bacterium]